MEIDLETYGKRKSKKCKTEGQVKNYKEQDGRSFTGWYRNGGISKAKIVIIIILSLLALVSIINKIIVNHEEVVELEVQPKATLNTVTMLDTRINDCDLTYNAGKWLETSNGLEARGLEDGYYKVAISKDYFNDFTLKDLVESSIAANTDRAGVSLLSSSEYSADTYNRVEVSYEEIEVNINNIVTGNAFYTREIYIQPSDRNYYFSLVVTTYEKECISYSGQDNDIEEVIDSLVKKAD